MELGESPTRLFKVTEAVGGRLARVIAFKLKNAEYDSGLLERYADTALRGTSFRSIRRTVPSIPPGTARTPIRPNPVPS
jgi:hypothetical protein